MESSSRVAVIGGGPAGSVAALTLQQLGHDVEIFERESFPRYRIGESLLPGTLSILSRLGMEKAIDDQEYVRKPSATFLWGVDQPPWTFSFAAPKTKPWVFRHAVQVKREDFDTLLLETNRERGVRVHQQCSVTDVDLDDPERVRLSVRREGRAAETVEADFVIDAGGSGGPVARKLGVRRYDEFYRNFAVWSYFRRADPFEGDLKGTTFSITYENGWVWMIPLKGDLYSVGVVIDRDRAAEVREQGPEAFFRAELPRCRRAMELLGDAEIVDKVRIVQDWSYEAELFSAGRFFLCGDAACFTDPLFSQGVHLATQSAVCAATAIDRISRTAGEESAIHDWYNRTYRAAYEQYHEFLASFYTYASFTEPDSEFWRRRRITESDDSRLSRKQWFERLSHGESGAGAELSEFHGRAATMIAIGGHQRPTLSDDFSESELNAARMTWISEVTSRLNGITRLCWNGSKVVLEPDYKVEPESFRLESSHALANELGRALPGHPMTEADREVFADLAETEFGYRTLARRLASVGRQGQASQIVLRLIERGLLTGYDKDGEEVAVQGRLDFGGVGVDYEV